MRTALFAVFSNKLTFKTAVICCLVLMIQSCLGFPDAKKSTNITDPDKAPLLPQPPFIQNYSFNLQEDGSLSTQINPAALGQNIVIMEQPLNGTLTFNQFTGGFLYIPNGDYNGQDRFEYAVMQGTVLKGSGEVLLNCSAVNDAPIVTTNTGLTFNEGGSSASLHTALVVADVDHLAAEISIIINSVPQHGILNINGQAATAGAAFNAAVLATPGAVIYTHNGSEILLDSFQFVVSDADLGATAAQTFNFVGMGLNDQPILVNNQNLTVFATENRIIDMVNLLITDADNSAAQIVYSIAQLPVNGSLQRGTVNLVLGSTFTQSEINSGQIRYMHDGLGKSSDLFTFTATDGQGGLIPLTSFSISITPNPATERVIKVVSARSFGSGGGNFNCALSNAGRLKCWGANSKGQLGLNNTTVLGNNANEMGDSLPVNLVAATVDDFDLGSEHGCAVLPGNILKCWGRNSEGQLGYGNQTQLGDNGTEMQMLSAVDLGGVTPKSVVLGGFHSCIIDSTNNVRCWGFNAQGQLGQGHTLTLGDDPNEMGANLLVVPLNSTVKKLVAGERFNCAILADDTVKCWGQNQVGQLGLGDTNSRGDVPNEMAQNLPIVNLGTGRKAKDIAAGLAHVCALLDNDTVKCWGNNSSGQLGKGNTTTLGDGPNEMGDTLAAINFGSGLVPSKIYAGDNYNCVIFTDNRVKCWGGNANGQLGLGNALNRGDNANEMGDNLIFVDVDPQGTPFFLTAGTANTCALYNFFHVKCWGANASGQLGYGDVQQRGDNANEMGSFLLNVNILGTLVPVP